MKYYPVPPMIRRRSSDPTEVVMPIYTSSEEYIRIREYERHCEQLDRERLSQGLPIVIGAICVVVIVMLLVYKISER